MGGKYWFHNIYQRYERKEQCKIEIHFKLLDIFSQHFKDIISLFSSFHLLLLINQLSNKLSIYPWRVVWLLWISSFWFCCCSACLSVDFDLGSLDFLNLKVIFHWFLKNFSNHLLKHRLSIILSYLLDVYLTYHILCSLNSSWVFCFILSFSSPFHLISSALPLDN